MIESRLLLVMKKVSEMDDLYLHLVVNRMLTILPLYNRMTMNNELMLTVRTSPDLSPSI